MWISYAPDSDQHVNQVHRFASLLREKGVHADIDLWHVNERRDWMDWSLTQLYKSAFVLVIASPMYQRAAEGGAVASRDQRRQFDATLLREQVVRDPDQWLPRILPVLLPDYSVADIPAFLRPISATHYRVTDLSFAGIEDLYRVITKQPRYVAPPVRQMVELPVETASPGIPEKTWIEGTAPAPDQPWQPGNDVRVGVQDYLINDLHHEVVSTDRAWVRRQAEAQQLAGPGRLVVLRQVRVLRKGDRSRKQHDALDAEARLLSELDGTTGIPRLHDYVPERDGCTLVLDRPKATSLGEAYGMSNGTANSFHPIERARLVAFLRVVHQLCRILHTLHQRRISHRTLSPSNILLVDNGRTPVLRDIGLATMKPAPDEGFGTYQAPEQQNPARHARPPGPHTDVYRLAAITYHTLTGDVPSKIAAPVTATNPYLPRSLDHLLTKALSPEATERPRSAMALADGLAHAMSELRQGGHR